MADFIVDEEEVDEHGVPLRIQIPQKNVKDIDRLVTYFQRHIDDDPHDSTPSIRSVASMVPMRSPATGGFSGGWCGSSNDGGWRGSQSSERGRGPQADGLGYYKRILMSCSVVFIGRSDYRNGDNQEGHQSGLPRPYGGRGRGSFASGRENTQLQGPAGFRSWFSNVGVQGWMGMG
ncbi:hypothetical protein M9H77_11096 [Catharanthus roseus]|uniref:Uncharacterized protein n=1 Tax=Catharanthus roseus TaxID=4058 RepID=A0ACC0BDL5_CATRO|nr:hypothetical protein M9H77_11096 [Catharanthus roseus]